jgi:hypothetical protein
MPILISALQNVVLGVNIYFIDGLSLKVFIVLNYISFFPLVAILLINRARHKKMLLWVFLLAVIITITLASLLLTSSNILSVFASFRNLTALFLFAIIGYEFKENLFEQSREPFIQILTAVVLLLFLFGFYELFIDTDLWRKLNLSELWLKKGLNIKENGLPGNFYASERMNGNYIRRMVSTYADPINFGTTLFLLTMISWLLKQKTIMLICLTMIILTVSKGAFLGVLVFLFFFTPIKFGRVAYLFFPPIILLAGIYFIYWAKVNEANSVFAHIDGFFSSFRTIFTHPFGLGVGNVGVISNQFGSALNQDIKESGLGMVIGQLGIPGLLVFFSFFLSFIKRLGRMPNKRYRVFFLSILVAFFLNMVFNEVALSPNSCSGYMLTLGFLVRKEDEFSD